MQIICLDSVESTNRYCELLDPAEVEEFTCYWALEQTAGIGQRGNVWVSGARGENLTFSVLLKPDFLPAAEQFRLTQAVSLAVSDWLRRLLPEGCPVQVKWPNDIYADGGKICGTLISCRLIGTVIGSAVCGIGLNVNQTQFPSWVPHPTSVAQITGSHYDTAALLPSLLEAIGTRYDQLRHGIDHSAEYLSRLMNLGTPRRYMYDSHEITATVNGVDTFGRLLLTDGHGRHLCCAMKEIALLD